MGRGSKAIAGFLGPLLWGVLTLVFVGLLLSAEGNPGLRRGYGSLVVYAILMSVSSAILYYLPGEKGWERFRSSQGWVLRWNWTVLGIVLVTAFMGAVLFSLVGSMAYTDYAFTAFAFKGAFNGGFYGLIWAPGIAFVWCAMLAKKRSDQDK